MRFEINVYHLDYLNENDLLLEEFNRAKYQLRKLIEPDELDLFSFYTKYDFKEDCLTVGASKG